MERITVPPQEQNLADPNVGTTPSAVPGAEDSPPTAQAFEWIAHGDATARRRARAHITRGFRRNKALEAQKASGKKKVGSKGSRSSRPHDSEVESAAVDAATVQPYKAIEPPVSQELALRSTLGSGRGDPFACLPVDAPRTHALLDHFLSGVAPLSFRQDVRANFNHVKRLCFEASRSSTPALHVILSAAASDIAALRGKQDSNEAIMHRGMALSGVNQALVMRDAGHEMKDESITAVALLAGNELLFGDPRTFNTHMDGLVSMVETRGGMESLRQSRALLYSVISWFDYSGACNLLSRRRFLSTSPIPSISSSRSSSSSSSSSPSPPSSPASFSPLPSAPQSLSLSLESLSLDSQGVPPPILYSLPNHYDLRQFITSTFYSLQALTQRHLTDPPTNISNSPQSVPPFAAAVNSELYRSICLPDQEGNRSRRRHITQSYHTLVLLYYSFLAHLPSPLFGLPQVFGSRLKEGLQSLSPGCGEWGSAATALCESLLISGGMGEIDAEIAAVIDKSITLDWEEWRRIKRGLLDFFVNNELCEGRLQTLWKGRLSVIAAQDNL